MWWGVQLGSVIIQLQVVLSAVRALFPCCCCPAGWHCVGQLQPTLLLPGGVKAAAAWWGGQEVLGVGARQGAEAAQHVDSPV